MALPSRSQGSIRRRIVTLFIAGSVVLAAAFLARPPHELVIESGPIGGSYHQAALQYQAILDARGITVRIVPQPNSLEIIGDVANPAMGIDVGFIAQDVADAIDAPVFELGKIELQPLFIFASAELGRRSTLDDLRGRRIVMPPAGSATSDAAVRIFKLYDITPENSFFTFKPIAEAVADLRAGRFDAGAFMLAPANPAIRGLAADSSLRLVPVAEVKAIANHLPFLRPVLLPRGIYNIADGNPPIDTPMIAAGVGVVVRSGLDPYLIYALLEAMTKVHRGPTYISAAGEFPTANSSQLPIHPLAAEYYQSGVRWPYRELPPWPASIVDKYLLPVLAIYILSRIVFGLRVVADSASVAVVAFAMWLLRIIERSVMRTARISRLQLMLVGAVERMLRLTSQRHEAKALIARLDSMGHRA